MYVRYDFIIQIFLAIYTILDISCLVGEKTIYIYYCNALILGVFGIYHHTVIRPTTPIIPNILTQTYTKDPQIDIHLCKTQVVIFIFLIFINHSERKPQ